MPMKKLFDLTTYPLSIEHGKCAGCDSGGNCQSIEAASAFRALTGLDWPDEPLVGYPLRKDCHTLGIVDARIPSKISLCLECAVAYMKNFNSLNAARKKRIRKKQR